MKRLLLTGFGPFGEFNDNPSEAVVNDLESWLNSTSGYQCKKQILPVVYNKAGPSVDKIDFSNFDFTFEFGVAAGRTKISLERVALNWIESSKPDNAGVIATGQKISSTASEALFNNQDLAALNTQLNTQWPETCEVSFSAGAYLCNFVYFHSLTKTNKCLFIHIPAQIKWNDKNYNYKEEPYKDLIFKISQKIITTICPTPNLWPLK